MHLALFYAAYLIAGGLGQGLAIIPGISITFWPPAGIFVASLLLTPQRAWPWWIGAAALAELTANILWFRNGLPLAVAYFGANALEAITAALLIDRFAGRPFKLETLGDVGAFAVLGAGLAPVVGATLIATIDSLIGRHSFTTAWPLVWLGDGAGLMVSTPLTLSVVELWRARTQMPASRLIEAVTLTAILIAGGVFALRSEVATPYAMLPALVWIAVRFQVAGAAAALALVVLLASFATASSDLASTASAQALRDHAVELQAFLVVSGLSTLIVAVLSLQHRRSQERLRIANAELAARVTSRTAALRTSETRLRDAVEIAKLATYRWRPGTDELVWDDRLRGMFGLPLEAPLTPNTWREAIHPDDRQATTAALVRALDPEGDGIFDCEYRVVGRSDGIERWVAARGQTLFHDGRAVDFIGTAIETTERKRAEAALKQSERRLSTVLNALPIGVALIDRNGEVLTGNAVFKRFVPGRIPSAGNERAQLWQGFDGNGLPISSDEFSGARALRGETVWPGIEYLYFGDTERGPIWTRVAALPFNSDAGANLGAVVVISEIDGEKRSRQALETSEQLLASRVEELQAFLENSPIGISLARDPACRDIWVNPALRKLLRLSSESIAPVWLSDPDAVPFRIVKNGEPVLPSDMPMERACATGRPVLSEELEVHFVDGSKRILLESAQPLFSSTGRVRGCIAFDIDITERKQAEHRRQESEERLRLALEAAGLGMWSWNLTSQTGSVTPLTARMFGLPEDDLTPDAETYRRLIHPDDVERIGTRLIETATGPAGYDEEYRIVRTDGEVRWLHSRGRRIAIPGEGADRFNLVGISRDITDKKRAEDALKRSELEFRTLANAAPAMVWVADANWGILYMNDRWHRYTGKPAEAALGFGWTSAVHPDDLGHIFSQWRECREAGVLYEGECRYRRCDGAYRWHAVRALPQLGPDGAIEKWFGVGFDIHDQEMAQQATSQLAAIVTSSSDAILGLTPDGTVTSWNDGAEHMYGYTADEMVGSHINRIVPEELKAFETEVLSRVAAGETIANLETVRVARDGRQIYISLSVAPVRDSDGTITGLSKIARDITERRLLMKEINHRAKNMLGLVQAIARQTVTSTPKDFLDRFLDRLQALAANHDLLVKSEWKGVDLKTLLRAQLAPFADLIGRRIRLKGARFRLSSTGAQAIGMALHELATNAGKYGALSNDDGVVDITWTRDGDRFKMQWNEMHGPPVAPPTRQGFGSTVVTTMTKMSTNGTADITFAPAGIEWRLDCPISEILETGRLDETPREVAARRVVGV
ncbi:MAG: PAS domain S-box protein [Hyphomicrobiaceae bacterium]